MTYELFNFVEIHDAQNQDFEWDKHENHTVVSLMFPIFVADELHNIVICRFTSKALVKTSKEGKKTGMDETDDISR